MLAERWASRVAGALARPAALVPDAGGSAELMRAVAHRDEAAFGALYDRYATGAYSLALRICGDRESAEEVVEDAFLLVWRNAASFDPSRGELGGWLARIVRNRALDEHRRRARRPGAAGADPADRAAEPPDIAIRLDVAKALAALSGQQRKVLELAYFGGLSQREIAERLEMPLGTVKSHTRRGLDALRESLRSA